MVTLRFETASAADLDAIRAVLSTGDLPVDDVDRHVAEFILAKLDGRTIGTVALEYAGTAALLRSLCVVPEHRGQAVGVRLLAAIEAEAASHHVRDLYLLTTGSAVFFGHHGASRARRNSVRCAHRRRSACTNCCPRQAPFHATRLRRDGSPA